MTSGFKLWSMMKNHALTSGYGIQVLKAKVSVCLPLLYTLNALNVAYIIYSYTHHHSCVAEWPTKKGLALTPQRWVSLLRMHHLVEDAIEDMKNGKDVDAMFHVSGPIFLTMKSPYTTVNIRQWFMKDGVKLPTKKGVVLRHAGWKRLFGLETKMETCLPVLKGELPCYFSADHANQMGAMECPECTPFY